MRVVVRLFGVVVLACLLAGVQERAGEAPSAEAAFPGANGKIAFYTNRNIDHHDLYLMDANGANQTLVDTPPIYASTASPAWSPDGQHLAFTVATGGMTQVFVGDVSGPTLVNVRNVSGTQVEAIHLGWLRGSGQQNLVFARGGQILMANIDNPAATTPLTFDRPITWPSWSPDGSTIAHTRLGGTDGVPGIHLMDSDGSNIRQLTTESSDSFPDWSPDGSKIVFSRRTAPDELSVMLVNANGSGAPTPLISQPVQPYPAWSPDGTKIVFTDWIGGTTIISAMNPDGTGVNSLTNTVGFHDFQPAWQPLVPPIVSAVEFTQGIQVLQSIPELMSSLSAEGGVQPQTAPAAFPGENGKIAFSRGGDIYTVNADGTGEAPLIAGPEVDLYPSWSPDGEMIAFVRFQTGAGQLMTASASGGGIAQITDTFIDLNVVSWSPDATQIAFARGNGLFLVDVDSHAETPITNTKGASAPEWSPLGDRIAYQWGCSVHPCPHNDYEIHTIDVNGQNDMLVAGGNALHPSWSPDGQRIAYLLAPKNDTDPHEIRDVSAAGGASHNIVDLNTSGNRRHAWSPDGKEIAFADSLSPNGVGLGIFAVHVATGVVRQVTAGGDSSPDWQPLSTVLGGVEFTQGIQQLQSLSALQSDLQGDGKPPVPMIEGKPAAMRIYFAGVDQSTDYSVEVSGQFSDNEIVNLAPGCTPTQRRAQTGGCSSVDFFFTPPEGNWSVRLVVKDILNQVVLDEEFDLTSVYMGELSVRYLPICVKMTPGASATCPTSVVNGQVTGLVEKYFPFATGDFHYSRFPVPAIELAAPMTTYPPADALIVALRFRYNLMALGNLAPDQLAGWLPGGAHTQYLGLADPIWFGSGEGRVSWQIDQSANGPLDSQFTLAHEIAHNYGARHPNLTDSCGAVDSDTDWPFTPKTPLGGGPSYPNSTIQEVGFDVAAGTAIPATNKDMMSYCTPPVSGTWISPHTYNKLVNSVFVPQGFGVAPASAPIEQLVVVGSAQADGSAATIESAYVITTATPAEQPNPLGNYCLRTSGGAVLDYCFMLRFQEHQSGEPTESESFSLRMPLPAGTTHVSLAKGFLELDALELSASAPSVDLTEPDELQGEETIEWSGTDGDGDQLKYALMYTPDNGQTWYPIAVDLTEPEFTFDTSVLEGDEILIRVLASDGLRTTVDTTGPVTVIQGTERTWGDNNCSGAVDPVDSLLTLRFDSGQSASTGECPAFGEQVEVPGGASFPWGDIDCSGGVAPVDALKLLRFDAGLSAAQGPGCPPLGGGVLMLISD